jgi:hypothetical protein
MIAAQRAATVRRNPPCGPAFVLDKEGEAMNRLWSMEQDFWLKGADFYEKHLDARCVMAFPAPAGIMRREAILASLEGMARWQSAAMSNRTEATPAADLAILAYEVEAHRDGAAPYRATCLSTYRRDEDHWQMMSHQQTPAASS